MKPFITVFSALALFFATHAASASELRMAVKPPSLPDTVTYGYSQAAGASVDATLIQVVALHAPGVLIEIDGVAVILGGER